MSHDDRGCALDRFVEKELDEIDELIVAEAAQWTRPPERRVSADQTLRERIDLAMRRAFAIGKDEARAFAHRDLHDAEMVAKELRARIDNGMAGARSQALHIQNQSSLLIEQQAALAKGRLRERAAWSTVKALAVAHHAPASERAADAALAALEASEAKAP